MTTTAVRFAPEERDWIKSYADFRGMTVSELIRESVFEKIEDELDILAYNEAISSDDGTRYTLAELMEKYGLAQ